MGDVADMILDGILCEGCGECIGDDVGFPRVCESCAQDEVKRGGTIRDTELGGFQVTTPIRKEKVPCPECGKKFARSGLSAHQLAKHQRLELPKEDAE